MSRSPNPEGYQHEPLDLADLLSEVSGKPRSPDWEAPILEVYQRVTSQLGPIEGLNEVPELSAQKLDASTPDNTDGDDDRRGGSMVLR